MTRMLEFQIYLKGKYVEANEYEPEYFVEAEASFYKAQTYGWQVKDIKIIAIWHELDHVEDHKSRQYISFSKLEAIDQAAVVRFGEVQAYEFLSKADIDQELDDEKADRQRLEIKELD